MTMKKQRRPWGMPHTLANDTIPAQGRLKTLCYVWRWATYSNGYGHIGVTGKSILAHRWYYEQLVGTIPQGMTLDHLCGNVACVAPLHLEPVPIQINSQRRRDAKLNPQKVVEIRKMSTDGVRTKDIAAIMGVCRTHVLMVLNGTRWGNT